MELHAQHGKSFHCSVMSQRIYVLELVILL